MQRRKAPTTLHSSHIRAPFVAKENRFPAFAWWKPFRREGWRAASCKWASLPDWNKVRDRTSTDNIVRATVLSVQYQKAVAADNISRPSDKHAHEKALPARVRPASDRPDKWTVPIFWLIYRRSLWKRGTFAETLWLIPLSRRLPSFPKDDWLPSSLCRYIRSKSSLLLYGQKLRQESLWEPYAPLQSNFPEEYISKLPSFWRQVAPWLPFSSAPEGALFSTSVRYLPCHRLWLMLFSSFFIIHSSKRESCTITIQRYNKHFVQTNFRIFICRIIRLYFTEIILTKFANKAGIMYLCRQ